MQIPHSQLNNCHDNRPNKKSATSIPLSLLGALGAIGAIGAIGSVLLLNSCASDPALQEFHPIPDPMNIPTPIEVSEDILPDPIDNQDFNNPPEDPTPVVASTPTAKHVPGRPGFVFNPFTQNMVDVDGIPSGTKVRDPQDNNEDNKFYVP